MGELDTRLETGRRACRRQREGHDQGEGRTRRTSGRAHPHLCSAWQWTTDHGRRRGRQPGEDRGSGLAQDRRRSGSRVRRRRHRLPRSGRVTSARDWRGLLFVAPFLLLYSVILIFPLLRGLWLSLNQVDVFGAGHFVGSANYVQLAHDPVFATSLLNTFKVTLMIVPTLTIIALLLAIA